VTARLQLVEAELFSLRKIQKESSTQAKDELLTMKEALMKKQATELDTREQRLVEATSRLQSAEASLKQLQGHSESCNGDLEKQL